MTQEAERVGTCGDRVCSLRLVQHVLDCVGLLLCIVLQGSVLDYCLIEKNGGSAAWYFWFLADFLVLIAFIAAAVIAYRHNRKRGRLRKTDTIVENNPLGNSSKTPGLGFLPLLYTVWFLYASLLTAKVILLFKLNIAQNLGQDGSSFGPQLLKVVIAASAAVFLLLVETHASHSEPGADQHFLITSTVFEIFDSVTFLGILFPVESRVVLTFSLENAILALTCTNFLLPVIPLYWMSCAPDPQLGLRLIYKLLHLALVNVPYFSIRVYLWSLYDHDVTLFILKNILAVVIAARTVVPETRQWWQAFQESRGKRHVFFGGALEMAAVYEITDYQGDERDKQKEKALDSTEL